MASMDRRQSCPSGKKARRPEVITQEVQQPFPRELALPVKAQTIGRRVRRVVDAAANVVDVVVATFRVPLHIESLDPKVRARMTAQEKAISDAYLHGL
jgi:hypothetical protein